MPLITLADTFNHDKHAAELINCCPAQVFKLSKGKAIVHNSRDCTTCRQCVNLDGVRLGKIKDTFICTNEAIQSLSSHRGLILPVISLCVHSKSSKRRQKLTSFDLFDLICSD